MRARIREGVEKRATPAWANHDYIAGMYTIAKLVTEFTGEPYEVDHIVPLRGRDVCGLHVEHNLQVIPMHDNRVKYNSSITGGNA
jgi:hypothetical protein